MCRLLGYCAAGPASLAGMLGEDGLSAFTSLSAFHGDGWGMAWYDGGEVRAQKSPRRAVDEPAYDKLAHCDTGDLGLVHLRWATPGLAVEARNTHPFLRDGIAMAHNGAIHPQGRLSEILPPAWEQQRTGTTDSERYFLHVLAGLQANGGDMIAALGRTTAHIGALLRPNSLNAVFLTPGALYAVCFFYPERIPHDALAKRGMDGPTGCYFDMAYREAGGAVVVASSGWPQEGWTALPNRHVLAVERATLRATVSPLPAAGGPVPRLRRCPGRKPGLSSWPAPGRPGSTATLPAAAACALGPWVGRITWSRPGCGPPPRRPGAARSRGREPCAGDAGSGRPRPRWRSPSRSPRPRGSRR